MSARRLGLVAMLALAPYALAAQQGPGGGGPSGPGGGRLGSLSPEQREALRQERRGPGGGVAPDAQRPILEQRVRERFAMVVRNQLRLDDRQMRQLGEVSRKFEGRRRDLNGRERTARDVLRTEVAADKNADNPRVASALQEILGIQKERGAILEDEDKELSGFLTPVQRARWFALQDQLRRRVEEMRRRAAAGLDPMDGAGAEPPPDQG